MNLGRWILFGYPVAEEFTAVESKIDIAKSQVSSKVSDLREYVDRLSLTCLAMTNLLKS